MSEPVILTGDEVLRVINDSKINFFGNGLSIFRDMDGCLKERIRGIVPQYDRWTKEGVLAEVLCPGNNWQKGNLKIVVNYHVEFTPDLSSVTKSPLDDLRSDLNI
jgi:hypothetical protein